DRELNALQKIAHSNDATFVIVGTNGALESTMACTKPHWFNKLQCPTDELYFDLKDSQSNKFAMDFNQHLEYEFHKPSDSTYVINPIETLCDSTRFTCPVYRDNLLFYQENDYFHLTAGAIDKIYPLFVTMFESFND
ncbi:hypothetical protein N9383_07185, partial [Granulosicoccus sp.]|nr:hypothetical protein [Granulosicoccus sp.]